MGIQIIDMLGKNTLKMQNHDKEDSGCKSIVAPCSFIESERKTRNASSILSINFREKSKRGSKYTSLRKTSILSETQSGHWSPEEHEKFLQGMKPVSYTHLTLPTILLVQISVIAES
eukprot:TRINITY_DN18713_c0_g1_i1.p2 TRINITY_DN18713_c0_g1~~TRINITY_DN18713_c0_g1_i1.p2  ORF type:complete len:117 (+),score=22.12 TRINITY_DN18713_c0_g1_i1:152-502(+)